ncbi:MAG: hypothetical protein ABEI98_05000 [Halorhabdus sp.]
MTGDRFELSRRKALAALGTVGAASAGAGLGTSAFSSNQETFENNQLTAGELDLKVGWQEHYSNWLDDDYDLYPGQGTTYARMPGVGEDPDVFLPPGPDQFDAHPIELVFKDPDGPRAGATSVWTSPMVAASPPQYQAQRRQWRHLRRSRDAL